MGDGSSFEPERRRDIVIQPFLSLGFLGGRLSGGRGVLGGSWGPGRGLGSPRRPRKLELALRKLKSTLVLVLGQKNARHKTKVIVAFAEYGVCHAWS